MGKTACVALGPVSVRQELDSAEEALSSGVWATLSASEAKALLKQAGAKKLGSLGKLAASPPPLTLPVARRVESADVFEVPVPKICVPNFIVKMKVEAHKENGVRIPEHTEYGLLRTDIRR